MAAPLAPPRPAPAEPVSARQPVEHPASEHPSAAGLLLEPGQRIAKKYVLDRPAGFGGMAQLWVATNESTGAEVCVKLLVPDPEKEGQDEEAVERFRREAHAAARLSHRAIVRVFDLLELDDKGEAIRPTGARPHAYAIVMELLHGETLGDLLAKRGKLPLEEALDLFLPIASALGHAHRADVIHRDLKPDNIFLATEPDGHVIPKVLDFGVSKVVSASAITIDGVLVGTPCFMSPEQARGSRDIDARSDVFSAGILFYMMLSGRNPFEDAPTFAAVVDAVLRRHVAPLPDVPPPIWAVIERAIAKDPAERFEGATEMNIALRKAAGRRAPTESDPHLPAASSRRPAAMSSGARPIAASIAPPDVEPAGAAASSEAARRRRAIVAAVVGVAAALIVAAALLAVLGPKTGTDTSAVAPEPATSKPESSAAPEPPAPTTAAAETPPPTDEAEPEPPPAPIEPATAAPVKATTTPARATAPRRAPRTSTPATAPSRKPGQEPHKARDPGF